jgi:hypothetical protein
MCQANAWISRTRCRMPPTPDTISGIISVDGRANVIAAQ